MEIKIILTILYACWFVLMSIKELPAAFRQIKAYKRFECSMGLFFLCFIFPVGVIALMSMVAWCAGWPIIH